MNVPSRLAPIIGTQLKRDGCWDAALRQETCTAGNMGNILKLQFIWRYLPQSWFMWWIIGVSPGILLFPPAEEIYFQNDHRTDSYCTCARYSSANGAMFVASILSPILHYLLQSPILNLGLTELQNHIAFDHYHSHKSHSSPDGSSWATVTVCWTVGGYIAYLIFVIFFTRAKVLENEIYTEKRQFFALNL